MLKYKNTHKSTNMMHIMLLVSQNNLDTSNKIAIVRGNNSGNKEAALSYFANSWALWSGLWLVYPCTMPVTSVGATATRNKYKYKYTAQQWKQRVQQSLPPMKKNKYYVSDYIWVRKHDLYKMYFQAWLDKMFICKLDAWGNLSASKVHMCVDLYAIYLLKCPLAKLDSQDDILQGSFFVWAQPMRDPITL